MSQVAERTHIGAYVTPEQRRQLVELAQRDDRSVSSVIRRAIAEHVAREQPGGETSANERSTP